MKAGRPLGAAFRAGDGHSRKDDTMTDQDKGDTRTVTEALAARAEEVKHILDWARRRIDQAAAVISAATDSAFPDENRFYLRDAVTAIDLAEMIAEDVDLSDRMLESASSVSVCAMVTKVEGLSGNGFPPAPDVQRLVTEIEGDVEELRHWTVEKLAQRLAEIDERISVTA